FYAANIDVVIKNGRVRAGYHVAQILAPVVLIHFIGERPGTGLNQLSAYLTYGNDLAGNARWSPEMDHSLTTAVCSIHPRGKTIETAIDDILISVKRMVERKCSGVALGKEAFSK
ncbi:MAG: ethanolamine ammonia-lyase light chain EutC, partial [Desulfuromonadaceae bacterium]